MTVQSEHVRQHALSQEHKLAQAVFFRQDAPLMLPMQNTLDDDELLRGGVPQLADWLKVWRLCRDPMSWLAAEQHQRTDAYINKECAVGASRRALQTMTLIQREVVRDKKRDKIRSATFVSYGCDERDGHMLLRFRCDVPPAHTAHCQTALGTYWSRRR